MKKVDLYSALVSSVMIIGKDAAEQNEIEKKLISLGGVLMDNSVYNRTNPCAEIVLPGAGDWTMLGSNFEPKKPMLHRYVNVGYLAWGKRTGNISGPEKILVKEICYHPITIAWIEEAQGKEGIEIMFFDEFLESVHAFRGAMTADKIGILEL